MKLRFIAAIAVVTLLVLLVQDVPLAFYLHQNEQNKITSTLEKDALVLAARSQTALWDPSSVGTEKVKALAETYRKNGGARIVIVDSSGKAVVTSDDDQAKVGENYSSRPEMASALSGKIVTGTRYSTSLKQSLVYVTVPAFNGDKVIGAVRLTYPEQVVTDAVNSQIWVLALVALTTLVLAAIAGTIFARGVTKRLTELERATEAIAEGNLSARADTEHGAPELRSLARSLNAMTSRLEALIVQQKSFASDASHQLRTPLTALKLRLEKASELLTTDPTGAADRLAAAELETDRLSQIIEGLLQLSRNEASTLPAERVDVAHIAKSRIAHWLPLADEQRVTITFDGPDTAIAMAVPTAVDQIVDNFIDNALSVSPKESTVTVRVHAQSNEVTLTVSDEGPGLSLDECARAFDRFWRASSETPGSGLGLAIVAQLATASGGSAWLKPRSPRGLDAIVRLEAPRV